jgi:hypothetical protein
MIAKEGPVGKDECLSALFAPHAMRLPFPKYRHKVIILRVCTRRLFQRPAEVGSCPLPVHLL